MDHPIWILIAFLLIVCITLLLKFYFFHNKSYWTKRGVETIRLKLFIEALRVPFSEIDQKIYNFLKESNLSYAGMLEIRQPILYIRDPELIKNILVRDFEYFMDRRRLNVKHDPDVANSLLNKEGQEWKTLRSIITPIFSKIKNVFSSFQNSSQELVEYIKREVQDPEKHNEINIKETCIKFTVSTIVSRVYSLNSEVYSNANSIFRIMSDRLTTALMVNKIAFLKFLVFLISPKLFNILQLRIMDQKAIDFFTLLAKGLIEERRESNEKNKREDFLQLLLDRQKEMGKSSPEPDSSQLVLKDQTIISQCTQFFLGGFETTEIVMSYCIYELALNPQVQETLYSEINKVLQKEELTYDNIQTMKYLDMVMSETLRKYPPSSRLERRCVSDYRVEDTGLVIEKDVLVVIPSMAIQNDEDFYTEPHKFIPERFSNKNKSNINPSHYMPFGHGARACVGKRFALITAKIAIANMVYNFKFEPSEKTTVPMEFVKGLPILKPKNGIYLKVNVR